MKNLLQRFLTLSRKQQITFVVWVVHLSLLLLLTVHHVWPNSRKKTIQPMAIHTFVPIVESKPKAPPVSKPKAPVKRPAPASKKPSKPAAKPPTEKKSSDPTLLKELQAALSELDTLEKHTQHSNLLSIPPTIQLSSGQQPSSSEHAYGQFLIAYLEKHLELPARGEVKMQLDIDGQGRLVSHTVLSSENIKNSEFLKNRLPELTFPCFNDFNIDSNLLTFTILFCNAKTL
ncbi:MAG: hypothetical protein Q8L98_02915 [Chlamydiales bacterium]|nr:hypothetical protein [Chlamydiales bacterium]